MNNPTARFNALTDLRGWWHTYIVTREGKEIKTICAESLEEAAKKVAEPMDCAMIYEIHGGKRAIVSYTRKGREYYTVAAKQSVRRTIDAGRSAASFRLPHERGAEI